MPSSSSPPSLKRQLTLALAISLALLCLLGNGVLYVYVQQLSAKDFDDRLHHDMRALVEMTSINPAGDAIQLAMHDSDHPHYRPHKEAKYYHLSHRDQDVHLRSRSLEANSLPKLSVDPGELVFQNIVLPDGRQGRVLTTVSQLTANQSTHHVHFALAISREDLDQMLRRERWFSIALSALLIAAGILLVRRLTNHSFHNLRSFTEQLAEIDYTTLNARLPEDTLHEELTPVARRFNRLLARLQDGAEREMRFNANIAHELRTPVAEFRAIAEVGLDEIRTGDMADPKPYFEDAAELAQRMTRLVETVLSLTRTGDFWDELKLEDVDLVDIIHSVWKPHQVFIREKQLAMHRDLLDQALIHSDRALVAAILNNLATNAISHSPPGSTITLQLAQRVEEEENSLVLTIDNPNEALKEADLETLTEPFWQKDASRSSSAHFGIGLSLVDAYCRLLKLEHTFSLPSPDIFRATLVFKRAPLRSE